MRMCAARASMCLHSYARAINVIMCVVVSVFVYGTSGWRQACIQAGGRAEADAGEGSRQHVGRTYMHAYIQTYIHIYIHKHWHALWRRAYLRGSIGVGLWRERTWGRETER